MQKLASLRSQTQASRGVVLPIVLVVLVVMTTLVITQVKRATVDERLAGNTSRTIAGEAMAQSLLRYCEAELQREPRLWDGVVRSTDFTTTPAHRSGVWTQTADVITMDASLTPTGTQANVSQCIIEDATSELGCTNTQTRTNMGEEGCLNRYFRKYRITSRVIVDDSTAFLTRSFLSQSELRLSVF